MAANSTGLGVGAGGLCIAMGDGGDLGCIAIAAAGAGVFGVAGGSTSGLYGFCCDIIMAQRSTLGTFANGTGFGLGTGCLGKHMLRQGQLHLVAVAAVGAGIFQHTGL